MNLGSIPRRFLQAIESGPMKMVRSEWWERHGSWVIGFLGAFGIVQIAILGWMEPTRVEIALLGVLALGWLGFAVANGKSWKRTLNSWHRTLQCWKESNHLVADLSSLLEEALNDLSTWDRDKADNIGERANTIIRMRSQNIDAKIEEDQEVNG